MCCDDCGLLSRAGTAQTCVPVCACVRMPNAATATMSNAVKGESNFRLGPVDISCARRARRTSFACMAMGSVVQQIPAKRTQPHTTDLRITSHMLQHSTRMLSAHTHTPKHRRLDFIYTAIRLCCGGRGWLAGGFWVPYCYMLLFGTVLRFRLMRCTDADANVPRRTCAPDLNCCYAALRFDPLRARYSFNT